MSAMNDDRFDDLKEAYALGALSESERREMEAYLADNPERQAEVDDLISAANLLALSAEEQEPPAELRRNIMSIVGAEATSPGIQETEERESVFARLRRALSLPRLATGAVVLAIVAGLLLWNTSLQNEIQDLQNQPNGPKTYKLQASGSAQGTSAKMVEIHKGQMILVAKNLPSVPKGKAYQMWAIENGKPRPGSVFEPGEKITTAPLGTEVKGADALAVTVEPSGGSPQPTSAPVLSTKL